MKEMDKDNLGYKIIDPDRVDAGLLDTVEYKYKGQRDVDITIEQPEFTSVCPMTGLPDFGRIIIDYVPDKKIVELKSLKFYLLQYRNVGIFYEHVVNRILNHLVAVVRPKQMKVTGEFTPRGGMTTRVTVRYEGKNDI